MKERKVGYLVLGFCLAFLLIVISYDLTLSQIVNTSCSHGTECAMYASLRLQRWISFVLLGVIFLIGLYFILNKKIRNVVRERKRDISLDDEERQIVSLLKSNDNSLYQSDLIKETGKSKVQMTRVLDRLEAKKVIDRRRRGMTNIIILK